MPTEANSPQSLMPCVMATRYEEEVGGPQVLLELAQPASCAVRSAQCTQHPGGDGEGGRSGSTGNSPEARPMAGTSRSCSSALTQQGMPLPRWWTRGGSLPTRRAAGPSAGHKRWHESHGGSTGPQELPEPTIPAGSCREVGTMHTASRRGRRGWTEWVDRQQSGGKAHGRDKPVVLVGPDTTGDAAPTLVNSWGLAALQQGSRSKRWTTRWHRHHRGGTSPQGSWNPPCRQGHAERPASCTQSPGEG